MEYNTLELYRDRIVLIETDQQKHPGEPYVGKIFSYDENFINLSSKNRVSQEHKLQDSFHMVVQKVAKEQVPDKKTGFNLSIGVIASIKNIEYLVNQDKS